MLLVKLGMALVILQLYGDQNVWWQYTPFYFVYSVGRLIYERRNKTTPFAGEPITRWARVKYHCAFDRVYHSFAFWIRGHPVVSMFLVISVFAAFVALVRLYRGSSYAEPKVKKSERLKAAKAKKDRMDKKRYFKKQKRLANGNVGDDSYYRYNPVTGELDYVREDEIDWEYGIFHPYDDWDPAVDFDDPTAPRGIVGWDRGAGIVDSSLHVEHVRSGSPILTTPLLYMVSAKRGSDVIQTTCFPAGNCLFVARHGVVGTTGAHCMVGKVSYNVSDEARTVDNIVDIVIVKLPNGMASNKQCRFRRPIDGEQCTLYWTDQTRTVKHSDGCVTKSGYLGQSSLPIEYFGYTGSSVEGACGGIYIAKNDGRIIGFHGLGNTVPSSEVRFYPASEGLNAHLLAMNQNFVSNASMKTAVSVDQQYAKLINTQPAVQPVSLPPFMVTASGTNPHASVNFGDHGPVIQGPAAGLSFTVPVVAAEDYGKKKSKPVDRPVVTPVAARAATCNQPEKRAVLSAEDTMPTLIRKLADGTPLPPAEIMRRDLISKANFLARDMEQLYQLQLDREYFDLCARSHATNIVSHPVMGGSGKAEAVVEICDFEKKFGSCRNPHCLRKHVNVHRNVYSVKDWDELQSKRKRTRAKSVGAKPTDKHESALSTSVSPSVPSALIPTNSRVQRA